MVFINSTWQNNSSYDFFLKHLIAKNLKNFVIKKRRKKKNSTDFVPIILIDRRSEIILRSPLIGSVSASDPMIVYRVNLNLIIGFVFWLWYTVYVKKTIPSVSYTKSSAEA